MRRFSFLCLLGVLAITVEVSSGQEAASGCSLPAPPFQSNKPNIFNAEQEQWLGDAQARQQESRYDLLPQKDSAELERIGQKLLAQLPPTPIHYHFRVYEAEDANGFSLAGGYVYISRKMITDARSEDEIAGVIAHEIGHIYTKQIATDITRELKTRMGVTSLGGREDVDDKLQQLVNVPWKDKAGESEDDEEKDELVADRVGLYALTRAGYAPKAFSENLDRIAANKGKTGNLLTDVLGTTNPISMRVRVARKIAEQVPEGCKGRTPGSSDEFKAFQEAVRNAPIHPLIEATPGLEATKLDPPMRQPLRQVRFSPGGKYILAQDEGRIHVLSRTPLKLLFSIDAPWARLAHFTPDDAHVVFDFATMRVEKWSVATGKRESYHELVDYDGCLQTSLSPDGRTFVCLSMSNAGVWLKLSDVATGKVFYDSKTYFGDAGSGADIIVRAEAGKRVGSVVYSQDERTMLILAGAKSLALDLDERKPIALGHDLSHMVDGRTAFVDSDKLVYQCSWGEMAVSSKDTFKICEASFPDGLPLNDFKVGYQWVEPVSKGNHVLIGPFKDWAAMLVDPATGKASAGFKLDSMDVYDTQLATENEKGGVSAGELGGQQTEQVDLPVGPMMSMEAAAFSPDGHFLAYSSKSRSSIWDLGSEKRVALMRPFRAARFDAQNVLFAQYQQANQKPGANFQIDLKTGKAVEGAKYAIDQFQRGDVLVTFEPQDKSGAVGSNVILKVADGATGTQLWTKKFPHDTPVVTENEDGTLVMQQEIDSDKELDDLRHAGVKATKTSDWKNEWVSVGLLVEAVDARTGQIRGALQAPWGTRSGSGDDAHWASLYGDYMVVHGNSNNTVIYRLSDGMRTGAFYGRAIAGDGKLGLIAATNRDQEVMIYDAATGRELKRVTVDQLPRAARFIAEKNALLLLTASQSVYSIDLPAAGHAETAQAHPAP